MAVAELIGNQHGRFNSRVEIMHGVQRPGIERLDNGPVGNASFFHHIKQ